MVSFWRKKREAPSSREDSDRLRSRACTSVARVGERRQRKAFVWTHARHSGPVSSSVTKECGDSKIATATNWHQQETLTHLVDELEATLLDGTLVLELNGVEGEGGGGGERDDAGREEGHRLFAGVGGDRGVRMLLFPDDEMESSTAGFIFPRFIFPTKITRDDRGRAWLAPRATESLARLVPCPPPLRAKPGATHARPSGRDGEREPLHILSAKHRRPQQQNLCTFLLSEADALTTTDALAVLARIWVFWTALPTKTEVAEVRAAIFFGAERGIRKGYSVRVWRRCGEPRDLFAQNLK